MSPITKSGFEARSCRLLPILTLLAVPLPAHAGGSGDPADQSPGYPVARPAFGPQGAADDSGWRRPGGKDLLPAPGALPGAHSSRPEPDGTFLRWDAYNGKISDQAAVQTDLSATYFYMLGAGRPGNGSINLATHTGSGGAEAEGEVFLHPGLADAASIYSHAFTPKDAGGGITQYAYSHTEGGSLFLALVTDGDRPAAAAYGAYADAGGVSLLAVGDISATETRTDWGELSMTGGKVTWLTPVYAGEEWEWTAGVAISLATASWKAGSRQALTIAPGPGAAYPLPVLALEQDQSGHADHAGILAGLEMRRQLTGDVSLALSLSGGPALYEGHQTEVSMARFGDLGATVFDATEMKTSGAALQADVGVAMIFNLGEDATLRAEAGLSGLAILSGEARPLGRRTVVSPKIGVGLEIRF